MKAGFSLSLCLDSDERSYRSFLITHPSKEPRIGGLVWQGSRGGLPPAGAPSPAGAPPPAGVVSHLRAAAGSLPPDGHGPGTVGAALPGADDRAPPPDGLRLLMDWDVGSSSPSMPCSAQEGSTSPRVWDFRLPRSCCVLPAYITPNPNITITPQLRQRWLGSPLLTLVK